MPTGFEFVNVELLPGRSIRLRTILVRWLVIGVVSLLLHRLVFLVFYIGQAARLDSELEGSFFKVLAITATTFVSGLRFDLATVSFWIGPFAFLISIVAMFELFINNPKHIFFKKINQKSNTQNTFTVIYSVLFWLQWLWLLCLNLVTIASTYNFSVNGKHLGWEFVAYFRDLPVLLSGSFISDPVPTTLLFLSVPVWLFIGIVTFRFNLAYRQKVTALPNKSTDSNWQVAGLLSYPVIILIISFLLFRGGVQQNPLRPGDAMTYSSSFLNNLKITGSYSIIHDLSDVGDFKQFYDEDDNIQFVQSLLSQSAGQQAFDPNYPLLRYFEPRRRIDTSAGRFETVASAAPAGHPPNIIILLMESWSAKFLEAHGYSNDVAPNFNALAKQGVFFQNFYAAGGRSANGLFSILTGIPDRAGRTILRSSRIFNRFGALPLLLKKKNYSTLFVHGGDLHFDNLDTGLPHLGFDELVGLTEMKASGLYSRQWTMGFHDEDMYDMLVRRIDTLYKGNQKPFFAMAFTSNNHHPFGLPDESFAIFDDSDPEAAFKNSYHYSDYALGRLISTLRTRPYFDNTIIFIVADHSHHANLDYLQDREIPLLIYAPAFFTGQKRLDVAGQLDILPTVLSLAGGDSKYAAMGRDLTEPLQPDQKPFAFFAGGSNTDIIGMVSQGFICYHYLKSNQSALLTATQPVSIRDLQSEHPQTFQQLDAATKHYYQFARTLEKENRIWPEEKDDVKN